MNRQQRRAENKRLGLAKKAKNPIPVSNVPEDMGFKEGDLFTVAGVKHLSNGRVIHNCKSGEETVFIVQNERK